MRDEGVIYVAGHPLLNRRCTTLQGCIRLRNDLYCVEWGVKLYSLTHSASQRHLRSVCLNELMDGATPHTVQHAWAGVLSVSQPRSSVWNSLAENLRDPALYLNSFRRQLKTFLLAHH